MKEKREDRIIELIQAVVYLTKHGKEFCSDYGYTNAVEMAKKLQEREIRYRKHLYCSYCNGNHENLACILD